MPAASRAIWRAPVAAALAAGLVVGALGAGEARPAPASARTLDGPGFAGFAVHHRADLNGDGHPDLVVGAPGASPGGIPDAGAVFVVFGPSAGSMDLTRLGGRGMRIDGFEAGGNLGRTVAGGDVNGDGIDDLTITAPALGTEGHPTPPGGTYVVFGGRNLPPRLNARRLGRHGFSIDVDGTDVATGDVNGDGLDDVIVGAANALDRRGAAIVVFGGRSPDARRDVKVGRDIFTSGTSYHLPAGPRGAWLGPSLRGRGAVGLTAASGDVNGDGYDDVILGAPEATNYRRREGGSVFVVYGRATAESGFLPTLGPRQGFRVLGPRAGDRAGRAVAASDIDGDGLDEIIVGAPGATIAGRGRAGEVFILRGRRALPSGVIDLARWWEAGVGRIVGGGRAEEAGTEVATADLDGDGARDLLVGAPEASAGGVPLAGRVYWVAGPPKDGETLDLRAPEDDARELFLGDGIEVAGIALDATDASPETAAQVIVGAPLAGSGDVGSLGRAYVVLPDASRGTVGAASLAGAARSAHGVRLFERGPTAGEHGRRRKKPIFWLDPTRLKVRADGQIDVRGVCGYRKGCGAEVVVTLAATAGKVTFSPDEGVKFDPNSPDVLKLKVSAGSWARSRDWLAKQGSQGRSAVATLKVRAAEDELFAGGESPRLFPLEPVVVRLVASW